ncbi:outer membrane beta-barrel protein [Ferruginibacter sp. SUN106]|uniref:outer membrane beta-barrel protein n=1 Tax=Ferruginibacter sp. SUN106 TaxID=2978348 RepID=UPI003D3675AB
MKKVTLIILLAFSLKGSAQSKPAWELIVAVSGLSNSSPQNNNIVTGSSRPMLDSAGNPVFLSTGVYTAYRQTANSIKYKSKLTAGITFGGRLSYPLNTHFDISVGATLSIFTVSRITENNSSNPFLAGTGLNPGDSIYGTTGSGSVIFIGTAANYFSSFTNQPEKFSFTNLNTPISIIYKKEKWRFETGITPSFIINSSKKKLKDNYGGEITINETPFTNNQNTEVGLSIGSDYEITKELGIGLEYVHGLNSLIDADNTRKLLTRTINLKLLYKL